MLVVTLNVLCSECGLQERAFVRKIQTLEMNTDQVDRQNILITGKLVLVTSPLLLLSHCRVMLQSCSTTRSGYRSKWPPFRLAGIRAGDSLRLIILLCSGLFSLCSRARRLKMSASKWPWRPISRTRFVRLRDILVGRWKSHQLFVVLQKLREELYGKEGDVSAARRHAEENEHKLKQVGVRSRQDS